jgi:heme exporter protein D
VFTRYGAEAEMNAIEHWLAQWLAMGGYAAFVWPAYGLTAAVLGGLTLFSWRRHRLSGEALARLQRHTGTRE